MAADVTNGITWLLSIDQQHIDWLAPVRHWPHLSVATDSGIAWVSGFKDHEIDNAIVGSIPMKTIWYQQGHLLFKKDSRLPSRNAPSLLWSPIERGLPVTLPSFNHNYFGMDQKMEVGLVQSNTERMITALITPLDRLKHFIETAAAIRLQQFQWAILDSKKALIIGHPILPISADSYWQDGNFLMPAGYCFEWEMLKDTIRECCNSLSTGIVVWSKNGDYISVPETAMKPLTIGAFRQSEVMWTMKNKTGDE